MRRLVVVLMLLSLGCAATDANTEATPPESYPQDPNLELLRSDIRAEKVAVITEAMQLTDEEAGAFWPVYREYEVELSRIWDGRLALIKTYGEKWGNMTDEGAKGLLERFYDFEERQLRLNRKYIKRFDEAVGGVLTAKFFQVEHRIDLLVDLQIASQLPVIVK